MNSTKLRRLRQLRAQRDRWDAQLRGIGTRARRPTRRRLATAYLGCVAVVPAAVLLLDTTRWTRLWFWPFVIAMVLLMMMGNATRNAADAPDHHLDEMLTRVRDSYRSRAYVLLRICVLVAFCVLTVLMSFVPAIGLPIVEAVFWPLSLLSFGLPTLLACWPLPDIEQPVT
jgi:fatty acid desaturase